MDIKMLNQFFKTKNKNHVTERASIFGSEDGNSNWILTNDNFKGSNLDNARVPNAKRNTMYVFIILSEFMLNTEI